MITARWIAEGNLRFWKLLRWGWSRLLVTEEIFFYYSAETMIRVQIFQSGGTSAVLWGVFLNSLKTLFHSSSITNTFSQDRCLGVNSAESRWCRLWVSESSVTCISFSDSYVNGKDINVLAVYSSPKLSTNYVTFYIVTQLWKRLQCDNYK